MCSGSILNPTHRGDRWAQRLSVQMGCITMHANSPIWPGNIDLSSKVKAKVKCGLPSLFFCFGQFGKLTFLSNKAKTKQMKEITRQITLNFDLCLKSMDHSDHRIKVTHLSFKILCVCVCVINASMKYILHPFLYVLWVMKSINTWWFFTFDF